MFLMNTFTDAQLIVAATSSTARSGRRDGDAGASRERARDARPAGRERLRRRDRETERHELDDFFRDVRESTDSCKVTVLTTLQCNFACDYCIQGDHGDYNKTAAKMSLETAARVGDVDRGAARRGRARAASC